MRKTLGSVLLGIDFFMRKTLGGVLLCIDFFMRKTLGRVLLGEAFMSNSTCLVNCISELFRYLLGEGSGFSVHKGGSQ